MDLISVAVALLIGPEYFNVILAEDVADLYLGEDALYHDVDL